jgi:DNA uptake protein ComE-like DNA-binding protein
MRKWWLWSFLPLGLGAWAPIYAGTRAHVSRWVTLGIGWSVVTVAGWAAAIATNGKGGLGGLLIIVGWVGAAATSVVIRGEFDRRLASPLEQAAEQAAERLDERKRAQQLARTNPELAKEVGIGRPDRGETLAGGLVDVNNCPAGVLRDLPGIDDDLATQIVEARAAAGGFSSIEDLGATADLPGDVVEGLRNRVVFLPRG